MTRLCADLSRVVRHRRPHKAISRLPECLILIEDDVAGGISALADLPLFKHVDGRQTIEIWADTNPKRVLIMFRPCMDRILPIYSVNACMFLGSGFLGFQLLACGILRLVERLVFVLQLVAEFFLKLLKLEGAFLGLAFEKSRCIAAPS